jgi:hypothetical protein
MTYAVVAPDGWVSFWPVLPQPVDFADGSRCFSLPSGLGVYNLAELHRVEWVITKVGPTLRDAVQRIW